MIGRLGEIRPSPDVFAVIMATGILSIAARNHEYWLISEALGILASVGLVVAATVVVAAAVATRAMRFWDLTDPDITLRLFTFVAACAVLDSRLASHPVVARILGVVALSSWLALMALTARNMSARSWTSLRDHAHGAWLLASVGTSGLAIVAVQVAVSTGHRWWLAAAVPAWIVALCIYGLMAWLILWRTVHERMDRDGFEPDTWILMGGLAIATLAGVTIHHQISGWLAASLEVATVGIWVVATLWIPPLIYFVLHRINQGHSALQFRGVWWALVFPLGMYSAATYLMSVELDVPALRTVSLMFFWNALTAWLVVVFAGLLRFVRFWRVSPR